MCFFVRCFGYLFPDFYFILKKFKKVLTTATFVCIIKSTVSDTDEPLAQSAEHLPFKQGVRSSNLRWLTKNPVSLAGFSFVSNQDNSALAVEMRQGRCCVKKIMAHAWQFPQGAVRHGQKSAERLGKDNLGRCCRPAVRGRGGSRRGTAVPTGKRGIPAPPFSTAQ